MLRLRIAIVGALLVLCAGLASPAGAFELMSTNGNPGAYAIVDGLARPGVTCLFRDLENDIDEDLRRIRVRGLKVYGPFDTESWVGYRFSVLQRIWSSDDYEFVFKGKVRKQMASKSQAAVFARRSWPAPGELPASDFRVLIDLFTYRKGSASRVRGKVRGVMEVYRHRHPTEASFLVGSPGDGGECFYNFHT